MWSTVYDNYMPYVTVTISRSNVVMGWASQPASLPWLPACLPACLYYILKLLKKIMPNGSPSRRGGGKKNSKWLWTVGKIYWGSEHTLVGTLSLCITINFFLHPFLLEKRRRRYVSIQWKRKLLLQILWNLRGRKKGLFNIHSLLATQRNSTHKRGLVGGNGEFIASSTEDPL